MQLIQLALLLRRLAALVGPDGWALIRDAIDAAKSKDWQRLAADVLLVELLLAGSTGDVRVGAASHVLPEDIDAELSAMEQSGQ